MKKTFSATSRKEAQEKVETRQAEAKQTVTAATEALIAELQEGKTERLQRVLQFAARFHRYSFLNQCLIEGQSRLRGEGATYVASFHRWQEIGTQKYEKPFLVRKGEKALWVWAPRPFSREVENKETHEKETHTSTGFVLVPVFADFQIRQEEGDPKLETFFEALRDQHDAAQLVEALSAVARADGFTVREEVINGQMQGYNARTLIVTKAGLPSTNKLLTLIHECAHAYFAHGQTDLSKSVRECEAEATAFVVASHFGIHDVFAAEYLTSWNVKPDLLRQQLERIQNMSHSLIEKMEKVLAHPGTEVPIAA